MVGARVTDGELGDATMVRHRGGGGGVGGRGDGVEYAVCWGGVGRVRV